MSKDHILLFSVATTTLLVGAILLSTNVIADTDVIDVMTLGVPQSCTMSGTGMNSHTASVENGIYTPDIGTTTLHAFCNDSAGFAIYAVGYTDNEFGKNVLTDSTLGNTYDIATGTATSGSTSNWAMKLAITQDSGDTTGTNAFTLDNSFGSYQSVPAAYTKVAHKNTVTDMTDTTGGVKLTTTYAVLISANQPAGTYLGQVKYTLVHPASEEPLQPQTATPGCINYFANASTAIGSMGCQSISASATSAILLASNFSREGYGFAGWSDAYDYATNNNAHFYGPQEDITFTAGQYTGTNDGLALYAVWVKSAGNIQSWNGCSSLTRADQATNIFSQSITALTDQRDSQTYAVAKLADGQCWMIENLRLEAEDTRDTSDIALSQGYNTTTFTGLADAERTNFSNSTATNYKNTSTAYYGADGSGAEIIISASDHTYSSTDYSGCSFPRYNNTNTSSRASTPTGNSAAIYSYGNYYTWAAAIADTAFYRTNNQSITNTSLCPTGWRLPQGGNKTRITSNDDNDFWNLTVDALNGGINPANYDSSTTPYYTGTAEATPVANKLRAFPNNFLYSGYFYTSSASGRGSYGYYWSSTAGSNLRSYHLYLLSSYVTPGTNNNDKHYGYSIRCVSGS